MAYVKPRPPQWRWSCGICKDDHPLKSCNKFLRASDYERYEVVLLQRYCTMCLARSHRASECKTVGACRICFKRHNTLLHGAPQLQNKSSNTSAAKKTDRPQPNATPSKSGAQKLENRSQSSATPSKSGACHLENRPQLDAKPLKSAVQKIENQHQPNVEKVNTGAKPKLVTSQSTGAIRKSVTEEPVEKFKSAMTQTSPITSFMWPSVFIPTATIKISSKGKSDVWSYSRALINQSSNITKIASSITKKLGILIKEQEGHRFALVNIRSRNTKNKYNEQVMALITEDLPRRPYPAPIKDFPYEEFSEDMLADMDPRSNTFIEMELGSDIYATIRRDGTIELEMGDVIAQKTALGYVFSGPSHKLY